MSKQTGGPAASIDWEAFFKSMGHDHVHLMSYGGDSSVELEKLYQVFKLRLLSETKFGNAVKKEKQ